MELNQGEIIQKPKIQELSSLFMTHRINVMHALVKFHEYIPYSLGVMARTRLTIWNLVKSNNSKTKNARVVFLINVMHALVKFHEYIPYSLRVMAPTRFTI